jgi:hypothetical protein
MKTAVKVLLGISIVVLGYLCYSSVQTPIKFEEERNKRENDVIASLMNIRKAEVEFKNTHGYYTASFDSLITFIKDGKMKVIKKEGSLSDEQLDKGLNEIKAMQIVKRGNAKEIEENGLQGFRRDTLYVPVLETLFKGVYDDNTISKIAIIPHSNNQKFGIKTAIQEKNNIKLPLLEVTAPYEAYLGDLNKQELSNLIDLQEKLDKYPGLKIGSVVEPNNNAGNWE